MNLEKRWTFGDAVDPTAKNQLGAQLAISPILAQILINRGILTHESALEYFDPQLDRQHDPFLMKDMDRAVDRILHAIENGERILIYGDYDVDGTTAVALMYTFFRDKLQYPDIAFYIPDRYREGYGISMAGIDFAESNEISLVIALDCGIKAVKAMNYAGEKGIDFIICDHHLPGETLPVASAILNPKQGGCAYPYKELSGCAVGYKLAQGLARRTGLEEMELSEFLDLVAVSICCDIVPITGENRVLTSHGLGKLNSNPRPGFRQIISDSTIRGPFNVENVVFVIGPRINAAGRIKHGSGAVELLIAEEEAASLADQSKWLNDNNRERKGLDQQITKQAISILENDPAFPKRKSTVIFDSSWHKGVVGIVASRLVERFYKPTIVLTEAEGKITGSARTVAGFDVHRAIEECAELLENFGGHTHAAGLTMPKENFDQFQREFETIVASTITEESLRPELLIDAEVDLHEITHKFFHTLQKFAPFGPGNMNPLFVARQLTALGGTRIVGDGHLKMVVGKKSHPGMVLQAIAFKQGFHFPRILNEPFDAVFHLSLNHWNGSTVLQLDIKDIKFPYPN
jgi:single-stranded-DNA-specific exonuclease